MMGTYDPLKDTRNPFSLKSLFSWKRLASVLKNRRGGPEDTVTITQAELDQKINDAVAAAKSGTGSFYEGFAPELKDHPTIKRYKSVEELAKGHLELEKKIGLKGVLVPSDGSGDDVKNNFYKAIGRPEKPELYPNPILDGLHEGVKTTTEQDLVNFKQKAFEIGLTSKQYDELYNKWYLPLQSQRLTDYDNFQKEEHNKASTALRAKWGGTYEEKVALANGLVQKFGSENLFNELHDNPNPEMIEFLANLGAQLSEDKLGELGRSGLGMTPEQAKQEIAKIQADTTHPFNDGNSPLHEDAVKKMRSLYQIAYPTTPA